MTLGVEVAVACGGTLDRTPTTGFHLVLRLRGQRLDPVALTDLLGVRPTASFGVGENRYAHSKLIAGWD